MQIVEILIDYHLLYQRQRKPFYFISGCCDILPYCVGVVCGDAVLFLLFVADSWPSYSCWIYMFGSVAPNKWILCLKYSQKVTGYVCLLLLFLVDNTIAYLNMLGINMYIEPRKHPFKIF